MRTVIIQNKQILKTSEKILKGNVSGLKREINKQMYCEIYGHISRQLAGKRHCFLISCIFLQSKQAYVLAITTVILIVWQFTLRVAFFTSGF